MHQHECSGRAMVVHATMNKEEEISAKLLNAHDGNKLGIKFFSFKWTSSTEIKNAIKMNYFNKEDLSFEMLKGISVKDTVGHECETSIAKEILGNVEVN